MARHALDHARAPRDRTARLRRISRRTERPARAAERRWHHLPRALVTTWPLLLTLAGPAAAQATTTAPWNVKVTATLNPLPIGACGAVGLVMFDATGKDHPRNPSGFYVQLADFDMTVQAPGGSAVGLYNGANSFHVCACQGAAVGSQGTVTATYPAKGLDAKTSVKGVAFTAQAPFTIAKPQGTFNPQGCPDPKTLASTPPATPPSGGSTAAPTPVPPAAQPAGTPVTLVPVTTMPLGTAQAVPAPTGSPGAAPSTPVGAPIPVGVAPPVGRTLQPPPGPGPAPSGISFTGTPASATLSWLPVLGAASYTVTRQQAGAAPVKQALTSTAKGMTDVGLRPATAYTYTLTAIQSDGRSGSVNGSFITPNAVNPPFAVAQQLATGEVSLMWGPVPAASYYVVLGPGSSNGGVKVSGNTLIVTGAPTGSQTWQVGSYYDPGPTPAAGAGPNAVSTPIASFAKAQLNVVAPSTTAKWTSFKPAVNGFRFVNDFVNNFIPPPIGLTSSGLCGGMSYAVMDYFLANRQVPTQAFRPANGTTLQMYLYGRQVTSLQQNYDKWIETTVNPFGSRTGEFFNWGINERLAELRSFIDRGVPVPLGMKGTDGGFLQDHQVLAIGYDMGRYKGDLGAYRSDLKLFILDPNFPGQVMTLVPDTANQQYHYQQRPSQPIWRTYFVDGKYVAASPPSIPTPSYPNDGLVHELRLEFVTGVDDMRGGADHVDFKLKLKDGTIQSYPNISLNGRWVPNYTETAIINLSTPVTVASMLNIQITTNATGGVGGDNWDMTSVQITGIGNGINRDLLGRTVGPYRFMGGSLPFMVYLP